MVTQFEVISKWLGVNIIGTVLTRGTKENMSIHLHIFFYLHIFLKGGIIWVDIKKVDGACGDKGNRCFCSKFSRCSICGCFDGFFCIFI